MDYNLFYLGFLKLSETLMEAVCVYLGANFDNNNLFRGC